MEILHSSATELLLLEIERLAPGKLVVIGDLDADDAEKLSHERGDASTRFIVRFFSDLESFRERELQVDAQWWPDVDESVQAVVIFHAREKEATDLRVAAAVAAFPQVREIFVVGHNKLGTGNLHKRFSKWFKEADKVASARHSALLRLAKPLEGAFPQTPDAWWKSWTLNLEGTAYTIWDLPGVFSRGELDRGSEMLIQNAHDFRGDHVLDLGAGSGVLSIARALRSPTADLTLVEHDILAVASAERNLRELGLSDRAKVIFGDVESVLPGRFDSVLTNPPFHAGSVMTTETTLRWLETMKQLLRPGGDLTLVANRHLPYAEPLDKAFKQVRVMDEDSKFRVWNARQPR